MLSEISEKIGPDWIIIDLSSQTDLLRSLTSQLYGERSLHKLFIKAKFDFSFMGLGVHAEEAVPAYDEQTALTMMLEEVRKQNKRVLVTIDEVDDTSEMRLFASVFQIFIRHSLPIYLLMAGIPENVYGLMNERRSTFLYRTPRIQMTPLNHGMIRRSYMKYLKIDADTADVLAGMDSKLFNVYRNRLNKKGILNTWTYGKVSFLLPRFKEFVQEMPSKSTIFVTLTLPGRSAVYSGGRCG